MQKVLNRIKKNLKRPATKLEKICWFGGLSLAIVCESIYYFNVHL